MPLDQGAAPETTWPPEFDLTVYRTGGLRRFLPRWAVRQHYDRRGRPAGLLANAVPDRASFLSRIPADARILEIGPFTNPVFQKGVHDVAYVDALTTEELRARARTIEGYDPQGVPDIDYVWRGERLCDLIPDRFDVVFSSHNIEHQTCLISHLQDVGRLLRPGGSALMFVPDLRYCFDAFLPESTLLDVIAAWFEPGARHKARDVVKHWLFATHNDAARLWSRDLGYDPRTRTGHEQGRFMHKLKAQFSSADSYIDVHAWQFTPDSFRAITQRLFDLGLSPLAPTRVYPTRHGTQEFFVVMKPE